VLHRQLQRLSPFGQRREDQQRLRGRWQFLVPAPGHVFFATVGQFGVSPRPPLSEGLGDGMNFRRALEQQVRKQSPLNDVPIRSRRQRRNLRRLVAIIRRECMPLAEPTPRFLQSRPWQVAEQLGRVQINHRRFQAALGEHLLCDGVP
jgi:hypothetical protein